MRDLLEKIYTKNAEFGWDQAISHGSIPRDILMIDQTTRRPISSQMMEFYTFALTWTYGITGFDVVDPNILNHLYRLNDISESIRLKAEDYRPLPPSDRSDWQRTALMAVEDGGSGLGLCLYWWERASDVEPCVVSMSGGSINVFADLNELAAHLANGEFPARGARIYTALERERGTLGN